METTQEKAWKKLSLFGLRHKRSHLGFNRYGGRNGHVYLVDKASGMKVLVQEGQFPRSERTDRIVIKGKRGRKPLTAEQRAEREAQKAELAGLVFYNHPQRKRGRKPSEKSTAGLVFFGPLQKRGRKPLTEEQKAVKEQIRKLEAIANGKVPGKRGRPVQTSEQKRLAAAKPGETVATKGGYWVILPQGIPSFVSA